MKKLLVLLSALIVINFSACKQSTEPQPSEQNPPGYQENIPWPSLAESPWPIKTGSAQGTLRSTSRGGHGLSKTVKILPGKNISALTVGPDSTLYYIAMEMGSRDSSGLVALSPEGNLKWIYPIKSSFINPVSPVVRNDGVIYISSIPLKKLWAIKPDGNLLWQIDDIQPAENLNVDKEGNLYFITFDGIFYSVSKDGKINWTISDPLIAPYFGLDFSPDGKKLIFISLSSDGGNLTSLKSFDIQTRSIEWESKEHIFSFAFSVDAGGNIYVYGGDQDAHKNKLFKYNSNGKLLWSRGFVKSGWGSITISKYGNCILALNDSLYSFNQEGKRNWAVELPRTLDGFVSSDIAGNIYLAVSEETENDEIIYLCYDKTGNMVWNFSGNEKQFYGQIFPNVPVNDRTYYIGYENQYLVIIK